MEFVHQHPLALFFGLAAAVAALAFYMNWRRRKALEELAASLGLQFSPDGPDAAELEATGLELFRLGRSRKASNLIGVRGAAAGIRVFDYRYVTSGGKNSQTHTFTLALLEPRGRVPRFELKPESLLYKLGEAVGFKDIDLPSFPEFSDKYRLTGPDEAAVRAYFTPQRAAWFERNPGLRVQGAPGGVLFFRKEGHLPAGAWQAFIDEAKVFAAEALR